MERISPSHTNFNFAGLRAEGVDDDEPSVFRGNAQFLVAALRVGHGKALVGRSKLVGQGALEFRLGHCAAHNKRGIASGPIQVPGNVSRLVHGIVEPSKKERFPRFSHGLSLRNTPRL